MLETPSFKNTLQRLKSGDPDAAKIVFERYASRLLLLARNRLNASLTSKVDPEDILQSALNSFFRHQAQGDYELVNWDSLWGLLALITARKCSRHGKRFHAERRGAGREFTLASLAEDAVAAWEPISREPTPSQVLILEETLQSVMKELTEQEQTILLLFLQRQPVEAIAAQIPCSERTIQRALKEVRRLLERQRDL
jgi:DNA-directed RNA polymerase specialized sigma24 family protein